MNKFLLWKAILNTKENNDIFVFQWLGKESNCQLGVFSIVVFAKALTIGINGMYACTPPNAISEEL